jgi:cell division protein FtsW (lipid II flippase)
MSATAGVAGSPTLAAPRRPRRWTELGLLAVAVSVGAFAYAQVDLVLLDGLGPGFRWTVAGLAAAALIGHVALRVLAPHADEVILPAVIALNGLGLAMIHRLDLADVADAAARGRPYPNTDAPDQLLMTLAGAALFALVLLVVRDHRGLQRFTYTAMLVGLVLLVLPLVPGLGATINGARIWIRLGGVSFQPAELAKIALIIFFAGYLVVKREGLALVRTRVLGIGLPRPRDLGPILVAWAASLAVLVFERDLGTSLLFFGLFVAMLYIATERRSWVVIGAGLFLLGSLAAYLAFGHVQRRVDIWLNPFVDPSDASFQIAQSLYGFANGGLLGTGLGQGYPQLVPYSESDFIVSAFGEELGLTGVMAIITLYGVIVGRGMIAAVRTPDLFGRLLASGLAFVLGLQVFVIVGGVTGLIPLTGLTTPFLSAGGSSLVANWILVALLLRVSDAARRPAPPAPPPADALLTEVVAR